MKTIGLILAGGSGTRLWPLSRKLVPKQLLSLSGNKSLLQEACLRIKPVIENDELWVVTNGDIYYQIKNQIKKISRDFPDNSRIRILKEPRARNTAPAILWAAFKIRKLFGSDTNMVIMPSDHVVRNTSNFLEAVGTGIEKASEGFLVTFGMMPAYPETGFGYIRTDCPVDDGRNIFTIGSFVEKPDYKTAEKYIREGCYLWNSGMFVFNIKTLLEETAEYAPKLYDAFSAVDPDNEKEVNEAFKRVEAVSIDYAVMEHTRKALVISADFGWSDVGNWKSVYESSQKDKLSNVVVGEHMCIDTGESYIYSKDRLVVALGLKGVAIVDTPDALLVTPLDQAYRVREIIENLSNSKSRAHIEHLTVERPWGRFKILDIGPGYKIKKIEIMPQERISTHFHKYRNEHWVVVKGTAVIETSSERFVIRENESTFIPAGMIHTLENDSENPLEIIETQSGTYLGEDDVVRIDA